MRCIPFLDQLAIVKRFRSRISKLHYDVEHESHHTLFDQELNLLMQDMESHLADTLTDCSFDELNALASSSCDDSY